MYKCFFTFRFGLTFKNQASWLPNSTYLHLDFYLSNTKDIARQSANLGHGPYHEVMLPLIIKKLKQRLFCSEKFIYNAMFCRRCCCDERSQSISAVLCTTHLGLQLIWLLLMKYLVVFVTRRRRWWRSC